MEAPRQVTHVMSTFIWTQLELILRLVVAGVCGSVIGYERRSRLKEAGIRTHMIVAIGAALIMVVSKVGFADVLAANVVLDPSRVAAQVVSGIGFLGAGIIFMRRQVVTGLTTAAGVWTTAGVGIAVGSGLYVIGAGATLLILVLQMLFHRYSRWLGLPTSEHLVLDFPEDGDMIGRIHSLLAGEHIDILGFKTERLESGRVQAELQLRLPRGYPPHQLVGLLKGEASIRSIEY